MKVLFKNKTKYTREVYNEYLKFHQDKYGHSYTFITIVMLLLLSLCMVLNFKYHHFFTAILLLIAILIYITYRFFYPVKKVQKELNTKKFKKESEFTFKFYDDFLIITDDEFVDKIKYRKLYKAFQTESFIYLYINKDHAFLLGKDNFSIGTPAEFMKFIHKKLWYKYLKIF